MGGEVDHETLWLTARLRGAERRSVLGDRHDELSGLLDGDHGAVLTELLGLLHRGYAGDRCENRERAGDDEELAWHRRRLCDVCLGRDLILEPGGSFHYQSGAAPLFYLEAPRQPRQDEVDDDEEHADY